MSGRVCPTERLSSFERTSASTESHKQRRRPQRQRGCFLALALYQLRGDASAVGRSGRKETTDILSWSGSGLAEKVLVFRAPLIFRSYIHKSCGCSTATSCQNCFQAADIYARSNNLDSHAARSQSVFILLSILASYIGHHVRPLLYMYRKITFYQLNIVSVEFKFRGSFV